MTAPIPEKQTILFLASNPDGLRRVGAELRDIKEGLRRSQHRDKFTLSPCLDVRARDIQRSLLDETPQIVHFAGSGQGDSGLLFEDESGNPKLVSVAAIAGLFALFSEEIRCVILNGCFSEVQANAIAQHIEFVIGMQREVDSEAAIAFAVGFYDALGAGRDIEFAFELGCRAISLTGVSKSPQPVLMRKGKFHSEPEVVTETTEIHVKLWNVPSRTPFLLSRSEIQDLNEIVLSNLDSPEAMTGQSHRIAVQGMPGIGKTVLVTTLAYDSEFQKAFPDGIYWLTVGIEPNLLSQQSDLVEALSGDRRVFEDTDQGKTQLKDLWQGQQSLLVLDDVWRLADAEAFDVLGERSTLLITTRDAELVTGLGAQGFPLKLLKDDQAVELLSEWSGVPIAELPPEAQAIAQECGNLPLALAQCGAMVRDLTPWVHVLSALQDSDLEFIQKQFSHYPYPGVFKALHVSATVLAETNVIAAERYQQLAVFPTDELIPESVVVRLWIYTGRLKERDAGKILTTLAAKGMLRLEGDYPNRLISLHDLQQDYLQSQVSDRPCLHGQLLSAYQVSCPDGWHSGPNDGYFFKHLAMHLKQAECEDELRSLLLDYRWIQGKLIRTDINALLLDYNELPTDPDLRLVGSGLRLSSHVLSQHPEELRSQLFGRLLSIDSPGLEALRRSLGQEDSERWFRCLWPSLNQAGGVLLRIISGHSACVNVVTVSPDDQFIISASDDETLKVWELATGQELRTLLGHSGCVNDVKVSPDGKFIISASDDNTIKVWELQTGEELRTFSGHSCCVDGVTVSRDGQFIISASDDNTIKVWELASGKELRTLSGHSESVNGVTVSPDGQFIISASNDKTLKVWELDSGKELRTLSGHSESVNGVTVSPDGQFIISASDDNTIKVWELMTGQELRTFSRHSHCVNSVTVSHDGQFIISASDDKTLKVWELGTGQEPCILSESSVCVNGMTMSPDGQFIIFKSDDKTLEVKELTTGQELHTFSDSFGSVNGEIMSPDGQFIIFKSDDKTLEVRELATGQDLHTLSGHSASINDVMVSRDGQFIISASWDKTLKVWELATGKELHSLSGHSSIVSSMTVSPDSQFFISASIDMALKVWDLKTGQELRTTLSGHSHVVSSVTVSPDSQFIISASWDKTLKVWELKTGKNVMSFTGEGSFDCCAIAPDGRTVVAGDSGGKLYFLRLEGPEFSNGHEAIA